MNAALHPLASLPLLVVALCTACGPAQATIAVSARMEIQANASQMRRGDSTTLVYTFTNTGDEPLDSVHALTNYLSHGPDSTIFVEETAATEPCLNTKASILGPLPPPFPNHLPNQTYAMPVPILPGETRHCIVQLRVSLEASGPFVQRFDFYAKRGFEHTSAQPTFVHFDLGEPIVGIPLLDRFGQIFLGFALALCALWMLRAHRDA